MRKYKVVVVEDESLLGKTIQRFLSLEYSCTLFTTAEDAQVWLTENSVDIVVTDIHLPKKNGMELLAWIRMQYPQLPTIIMTAYSSIKGAVDAIKSSAVNYISKPLDLEELEITIRKALEIRELRDELQYHREKQEHSTDNYVTGSSKKSVEVENIIKRLVYIERETGEVPSVLITGETGTGKGAIAKSLHNRSPRAKGPFIELNCTAIAETMFESELFGHEKGAFTGAIGKKPGLFEVANKGTLFLDEIGHMSLGTQAKLLKAIEGKCFRRVGGNQEVSVDVRLLFATNLDLRKTVQNGLFRDDLYHRLTLLQIQLPPLKERPEDLHSFAYFFLDQVKEKYKMPHLFLTEKNLQDLKGHSWPGNVRELSNEIERAALLYDGNELKFSHLETLNCSSVVKETAEPTGSFRLLDIPSEGVDLRFLEKSVIEQALIQNSKNISLAGQMLGVSRDVLRYRIGKYKINLNQLEGWVKSLPKEGIELESLEKSIVGQALEITRGNVTLAAKKLKISRDMLRYRISKFGLQKD